MQDSNNSEHFPDCGGQEERHRTVGATDDSAATASLVGATSGSPAPASSSGVASRRKSKPYVTLDSTERLKSIGIKLVTNEFDDSEERRTLLDKYAVIAAPKEDAFVSAALSEYSEHIFMFQHESVNYVLFRGNTKSAKSFLPQPSQEQFEPLLLDSTIDQQLVPLTTQVKMGRKPETFKNNLIAKFATNYSKKYKTTVAFLKEQLKNTTIAYRQLEHCYHAYCELPPPKIHASYENFDNTTLYSLLLQNMHGSVAEDTKMDVDAGTADDDTKMDVDAGTADDDTKMDVDAGTADDDTKMDVDAGTADDDTSLDADAGTVDDDTSLDADAGTVDDDTSLDTDDGTVDDRKIAATVAPTTDATKDATTGATKKATTYATTDATKKATAYATKKATKDATTDATKDATTDATKKATKDTTTDATTDATAYATKDATAYATKDATTGATKKASKDTTKKATTVATKKATTDATKKATAYATTDALVPETDDDTLTLIQTKLIESSLPSEEKQSLFSLFQAALANKDRALQRSNEMVYTLQAQLVASRDTEAFDSKLKAERDGFTTTLRGLKSQLEEKQKEAAKLNTDCQVLQYQLDQRNHDVNVSDDKISELEDQVTKLENEVANAKKEIAEKEKDLLQKQRTIDRHNATRSLQTSPPAYLEALNEAKSRAYHAERSLSEKDAAIDRLTQINTTLMNSNTNLQQTISQTQVAVVDLAALQQKHKKTEDDLNELRGDLDHEKSEHEDTRQFLEHYQHRAKDAEEFCKERESEIQHLRDANHDLNEIIKQERRVRSDPSAWHAVVLDMHKRNRILKDEIKKLTQKVDRYAVMTKTPNLPEVPRHYYHTPQLWRRRDAFLRAGGGIPDTV